MTNATATQQAQASSSRSTQDARLLQPLRVDQVFQRLRHEVSSASQAEGSSGLFPQISTPLELDADALQLRLISLAQDYMDVASQDWMSASFYSYLALTLYPESIPARRIRAQCLLAAGQDQVFPFQPHQSKKAGAAAAIEVLEGGPAETFVDLTCAKIWSDACKVLGRFREAEEVLAWALHNRLPSPSVEATDDQEAEFRPSLISVSDRSEAIDLCNLAALEKTARRWVEASQHLQEARKKDPWSWRAWIGLCELGQAPLTSTAFTDSMANHEPELFLDAAIKAVAGDAVLISNFEQATIEPRPAPRSRDATPTASANSSQSTYQRPGSRPAVGAAAASDAASAKRTKGVATTNGSGSSVRGTASRSASATGAENDSAAASRARVVTARSISSRPTASRTLSQARANERPPSSLSSTSRSTAPEKEKPVITRDSLRKSARTPADPTPSSLRQASGSSKGPPSSSAASGRTGGPLRARPLAQNSSESDTASYPHKSARTATNNVATSSAAASDRSSTKQTTVVAAMDQAADELRTATLRKASEETAKWRVVDGQLVKILRLLAAALKDAKEYKGERVLRYISSAVSAGLDEVTFKKLKESNEVKTLLGRVYHDMARYAEAERSFKAVFEASPARVAGSDIYSLCLFHLHRHESLSAVAQTLMTIDDEAVETHLTIGNLFSLNHSPSIALRSFRRACLAAPDYAYSYTLAGHECLALQQPLKALRFFREAVRTDDRHWNGWSGLATIFSSESQWTQAQNAIKQATTLNSSNAGLWEVSGIIHERLTNRPTAVENYTRAMNLNPKSASAMWRKAELLWKMNRWEPAHTCLQQVVWLMPNEPRAHLLLAQSYMRKGGGAFAPLAAPRKAGQGGDDMMMDTSTTVADVKAKAIGHPKAPAQYRTEISKHLAIAVDLDPRLYRRVKAMSEGVAATLRGQGATAASTGPAGYVGDASIGSSFSGIDESRHLYDGQEETMEGQEYSYGIGEEADDSMGVLQDEETAEAIAEDAASSSAEEEEDDDDEEDPSDGSQEGDPSEDDEEEEVDEDDSDENEGGAASEDELMAGPIVVPLEDGLVEGSSQQEPSGVGEQSEDDEMSLE